MLDEEREALEWLDGLRLLYPGTKIIDHIDTIQAMVAVRDQGPLGHQAAGYHTDAKDHPMRAR